MLLPLPPPAQVRLDPQAVPAAWWKAQGAPNLAVSQPVVVEDAGVSILASVCAVDLQRYLKHSGGTASAEGLLEAMQEGAVWTAIHIRFTEGLGARNRRRWLEAALAAQLPGGWKQVEDREVQAFLDLQSRDANLDDRLDYLFPPLGKVMWVRHNTEPPRKFTHPALVRAVRRIQFSDPKGDPGAMLRLLRPMLAPAREGN